MSRACSIAFAVAVGLAAPLAARAQTGPDLGDMLGEAQRFTVKVRGTVVWPFAPEAPGTGSGTGFIIDRERGWILTNAHVVGRSPSTVEVAIGDTESDWMPADRVYVDNHLDIAVVKVTPDQLPDKATAAKLGCSQTVKQGETIVAYGHPISLNFTATRGIVSNVRTLGSQEFVQMDANINPGNSGGPLLAVASAEVIGINTLNIAGASGLGLAVAIRQVCPIVDLLAKGEDPSLPSLPVYWLKQGRIETLTVASRFPRHAGEQGEAEAGLYARRRRAVPGWRREAFERSGTLYRAARPPGPRAVAGRARGQDAGGRRAPGSGPAAHETAGSHVLGHADNGARDDRYGLLPAAAASDRVHQVRRSRDALRLPDLGHSGDGRR